MGHHGFGNLLVVATDIMTMSITGHLLVNGRIGKANKQQQACLG